MSEKTILDACCGSRMFWFDKTNPNVLFHDVRKESLTLCDGRKLEVNPDVIGNFTQMEFDDESFKMVVFDPPHMVKLGKNSWMAQKYGVLFPTWQTDLKSGFSECMRVLEDGGVLIFKWNEAQVTLNEVLSLTEYKPLFGHVTGKHGKTIWVCFIKGLS